MTTTSQDDQAVERMAWEGDPSEPFDFRRNQLENAPVHARWTGAALGFEITNQDGRRLTVDEPVPMGGGTGVSPTDLLLSALAACCGSSAISLLRKMSQPVRECSIAASGTQEPDWPRAFTEIRLHFTVSVDGEHDPDLVRRAIRLAVTRYSPVEATMRFTDGGCRLAFDHEIVRVGS